MLLLYFIEALLMTANKLSLSYRIKCTRLDKVLHRSEVLLCMFKLYQQRLKTSEGSLAKNNAATRMKKTI